MSDHEKIAREIVATALRVQRSGRPVSDKLIELIAAALLRERQAGRASGMREAAEVVKRFRDKSMFPSQLRNETVGDIAQSLLTLASEMEATVSGERTAVQTPTSSTPSASPAPPSRQAEEPNGAHDG